MLPSLRKLSKELKISVLTITRAYTELEQDGFIKNVQGKGSYVLGSSSELIKEIKNKCTKIITDNIHSNYVEYNKIKSTIREELSKYLSVETGNKPMIITVTTEV